MLFHVTILVRPPSHIAAEELSKLGEREHERATDLQRKGTWLHLWRVVGQWSNISIFRVESPTELHSILESLPFYPYMTIQVVALCKHPGAIADDDA